jgi:hypothetical protein
MRLQRPARKQGRNANVECTALAHARAVALLLLLFTGSLFAQSNDQNFPTPLTTNDITGTIKARDMGDPRATTYFYAFDGGQGDIFINVVTKNFSGDIDVFTVDGMTPLAKMVIYADSDSTETGRLIYLRKPEQLLLRIQARTPNDDPATFRIKFGGSFIALSPQKTEAAPTVAKVGANEPGVKVDSVGRIVAIVPKPQPTPKIVEPPLIKEQPVAKENPKTGPVKTVAKTTPPAARKPAPKKPAGTGTVYENETAKVTVEPALESKPEEKKVTPPVTKPAKPPARTVSKPAPKKADPGATVETERPEPKSADPLASVRLVIKMKDGTVFWIAMNEVLKFTVDKGVMTVIAKSGSVTRYNILDVEKTTIQ